MDPVRLSLFFIILVGIGRIHHHVSPLAALRPGLLGFGTVMVMAVLNPRLLDLDVFRKAWYPRAVVGLFLAACLSAVFGISLGGSARFILDEYVRVFLVVMVMTMAFKTTAHLKFLVAAYVTSCGIWGLYGPTFGTRLAPGGTLARLQGTPMFDANDLGLVILVGFPLALWMFQTVGRVGRLSLLAVMAGIGYLLAVGGSRGAMVGAVLVGVALLLTVRGIPPGRKILAVVVVSATLVLAAPAGYWAQMGTILNPSGDYNLTATEGRVAIAKRGLGYMARYPVFGVGAGNFGRAEGTLSFRLGSSEAVRWIAPHNTLVQVGAEMGLVGLGIWLALLAGGTLGVWRLRRRLPRAWMRGNPEERFLYHGTNFLPLAFLAFASTSFFLSFAYLEPLYFLTAFLTGLHVHARRLLREQHGAAGMRTGPRSRRMPHPSSWSPPRWPTEAQVAHSPVAPDPS